MARIRRELPRSAFAYSLHMDERERENALGSVYLLSKNVPRELAMHDDVQSIIICAGIFRWLRYAALCSSNVCIFFDCTTLLPGCGAALVSIVFETNISQFIVNLFSALVDFASEYLKLYFLCIGQGACHACHDRSGGGWGRLWWWRRSSDMLFCCCRCYYFCSALFCMFLIRIYFVDATSSDFHLLDDVLLRFETRSTLKHTPPTLHNVWAVQSKRERRCSDCSVQRNDFERIFE